MQCKSWEVERDGCRRDSGKDARRDTRKRSAHAHGRCLGIPFGGITAGPPQRMARSRARSRERLEISIERAPLLTGSRTQEFIVQPERSAAPLRVLSFLFFTWSCGKSLLSL